MRWAAVALWVTLSASSAVAQEILPPQTDTASILDEPRGGAAERRYDVTAISLQPTREWRAFAEFDLAAVAGRGLSRAEVSGRIGVNNAIDTGIRTIELALYSADGVVDLADFNRSATALGTVSYFPPIDTFRTFSYDILTPLQGLLDAGATHVGLRARSIVNDAPNTLGDVVIVLVPSGICGDGTVQDPEECDDGDANSDTEPDACRSDCTSARCGDGVIDTDQDEDCDDGDANSDTEPGACPTNCMRSRCGDGVVADDEECDDGPLNSNYQPDGCRANCTLYRCGDGTVDSNEECDAGDLNSSTEASSCREDCVAPRCGDGFLDWGELCDEGDLNGTGSCSTDCDPMRPSPDAGASSATDAGGPGIDPPPAGCGCRASNREVPGSVVLLVLCWLLVARKRKGRAAGP